MCIRDRGMFSPTPDQLDYLIGQIAGGVGREALKIDQTLSLSLIHISEPTRLLSISYAVFCLKKKKHVSRLHTRNSYTKRRV